MSESTTRDQLSVALEHARRAVNIDKEGIDMTAAIIAYGQSVAILSSVIEELRKELSEAPQEKRIQMEQDVIKVVEIHNSYRDRMFLLSEATGIPIPSSVRRPLL
ncbi:hypothetical protein CVT26_005010 [Gymnopilus dilepis]|uniref:MIT domain-containing protein n=1 Tax=Gymnopilus dilepis TaxID=231916 RepID=A0A409Y056_9AGAR|nr:hypothetical protein CVT26_005010 [Gymnopilus dilepis]